MRIGAIVVTLLGVLFLLVNLDVAPAEPLRTLLAQWWPLILIVVGIAMLMGPGPHRAR
jgi:hypothetical protein